MDKRRLSGAARKAKGAVKEGLGRILGSGRMRNEGRVDKAAGAAENAAGASADALRERGERNKTGNLP